MVFAFNHSLITLYFTDHPPITNPQSVAWAILKLGDVGVLRVGVSRDAVQSITDSLGDASGHLA